MGKFGNRRLPKFLSNKETQYGMNPTDGRDLAKTRLKHLGVYEPNFSAVKVIKVCTTQDLPEIQAAGYKIRQLNDYGEFMKIMTPYEDEAIVHFEIEDDVHWVEMGYGGTDLVGYHDGIKYMVPVEVYGSRDDYEITEIYGSDITAEMDPSEAGQSHEIFKRGTTLSGEMERRGDLDFNKKIKDFIVREWEAGSKKPINLVAYRSYFTITDPISQIDSSTGEIATDEGEVIPMEDISSVAIHNGYLYATMYARTIASYAYKNREEGRANESFDQFVNECWSAMPESYVPGLSDSAKMAIKRLCEEILIHEAHKHDMSDDTAQTYESYLTECGHYMTECMMQAAQKLKV